MPVEEAKIKCSNSEAAGLEHAGSEGAESEGVGSDDAGSEGSGSTTPDSTSTYKYSHEPFVAYQLKVALLAQSLGSDDPPVLERMRGGGYNRVVAVTLTNKAGLSPSKTSIKGVIRSERFSRDGVEEGSFVDEATQSRAAVLEFLTSSHIPAPRLIAFDATSANDIQSPYIFQEFAQGISLFQLYPTMSLEEKLSVVEAYVGVVKQIQTSKFPQAGKLRHAQSYGREVGGLFPKKYNSWPDGAALGGGIEIGGFKISWGEKAFESSSYKTLYDLLEKQLKAWAGCDAWRRHSSPGWQMWLRLFEILEQMKNVGFFNQDDKMENVLHHWDLEARNILVRRRGDSPGWEIDKVIDWDDVLCLPIVLTRAPPVWLWHSFNDTDRSELTDGDPDYVPLDQKQAGGGQRSEEEETIKVAYEKCFKSVFHLDDKTYWDETYGSGRWIRRLARFALHGVDSTQEIERCDRFDEEWEAAYAVLKQTHDEKSRPRLLRWLRCEGLYVRVKEGLCKLLN